MTSSSSSHMSQRRLGPFVVIYCCDVPDTRGEMNVLCIEFDFCT